MTLEMIADLYVKTYKDAGKREFLEHVREHPHNIIWNIHCCIMYVRIYQGMLNLINSNPKIVKDHSFIKECYRQDGPHIYGLKCFGNAQKGLRDLIKGLVKVWNPENIVYHIDRDNFKRLHCAYKRRVLTCHS